MSTLFLKGGRVVNADRAFDANVLCVDGKIAAVGPDVECPAGAEVLDCTGKTLFPGGIDTVRRMRTSPRLPPLHGRTPAHSPARPSPSPATPLLTWPSTHRPHPCSPPPLLLAARAHSTRTCSSPSWARYVVATRVFPAQSCRADRRARPPPARPLRPLATQVACDDYESGTKAALAGGTTTICDFVMPAPGESLIAAFDKWSAWGEKSCCDFAYHVAVTWFSDQVREEMGVLANERGVQSFKHFLAYKGALMLDDEALVNSFTRCKELGCLPTVHAENGELVMLGQKKMLEEGVMGPEGHPQSRPPAVEGESANRAARTAQILNTPVYLVHVSCKEALEVVRNARAEGRRVFGEALAGHLTINDSVYYNEDWYAAAAYVMSPPFRPDGHPQALWTGLQDGTLQTTATDHCCFNIEQKMMGKEDFTKIPNGCSGVEERMAILYHHGVVTGKLTESEFANVTSTEAAKIFNMYPQKGVIAVGSDADIAVFDTQAKWTMSAKTQFSRVGHNPWEGKEIQGVNVATVHHGKVVYQNRTHNVEPGFGKYVPRATFGFAYDGMANRELAPRAVKRTR